MIDDKVIIHRSLGLRYDAIADQTVNIQKETVARESMLQDSMVVKPGDNKQSIKTRLSTYRRNHASVVECFPQNYRKFEILNEFDSNLLQEVTDFLGLRPISKAPRGFRIMVNGFPGSGKTTVANQISEKYGPVVGIYF